MNNQAKKRRGKGEGSWKQNANRSWTYRLVYGIKEDGKRKVLTVTAATKDECRDLMREKKREWDRKKECAVSLKHETLTGMCRRYTASKKKMENTSRDREECTIRNQIEKYPIGGLQVQAVKTIDVERHINQLIDERKISASSIDKVLDLINATYNWAIARKELDYNPVAAIKRELQSNIKSLADKGSDDEDVIVLSAEEKRRFVEEATLPCKWVKGDKYPAGLYGLLLLYTGMRCGEMLSLRWQDIDFENRIIRIDSSVKMINNREQKEVNGKVPKRVTEEGKTKNKKARNIVMNDEALSVLRMLRSRDSNAKQSDYIARTRTGKPYTVNEIEGRMRTIFKNAGMPQYKGGCHIFRRTFATDLVYNKGVDSKIAAEYIGDLEATLKKHYVAARKKIETSDGEAIVVVNPWNQKEDSAE